MRTLKLLVIGMGVIIVIATAALVTTIVQRAGRLGGTVQAQDKPIAVPEGFHIVSTEISGDRLLVRLDGAEPGAGAETRIIVVDLAHGDAQHIVRLMAPRREP
jgi:hypothetical protein